MAIWFYDCDMGQGAVSAPNEEKAHREAMLDAGRNAQVRNVHRPSKDEIEFRRAMGGWMPE